MQFPEETTASPLLVSANKVISAWQYPTMDGKRLSEALHELAEVVKEANRQFLLANKKSRWDNEDSNPDDNHSQGTYNNGVYRA